MSYLEDLKQRYPDKAACPLFLRAQLQAFRTVLADPLRYSSARLGDIAAAAEEIEAGLAPVRLIDRAAIMERAKARAHELGVEP